MAVRRSWNRLPSAVILVGLTMAFLVAFGRVEELPRPGMLGNPVTVIDSSVPEGELIALGPLMGLVDGLRFRCRQLDARRGEVEVQVEVDWDEQAYGGAFRRRLTYRFPDGRVHLQEAMYQVKADRVLLVAQLLTGGVFQVFEPGQILIRSPLRKGMRWRGELELRESAPKRPGGSKPTHLAYEGSNLGREAIRFGKSEPLTCWKIENRAGGYLEEVWLHESRGELRRVLRRAGAAEGESPLMTLERRL